MNDGFATGKAVLEDIASGVLPSGSAEGREAVMKILSQKGLLQITMLLSYRCEISPAIKGL